MTTKVSRVLGSWYPTPVIEADKICTEICDDVRDECSKFGTIVDMKVPRPSGGSKQSAGVGKIYVKFDTPESATKALQALAGRKFADRTVVTTYFPEVCLEMNSNSRIKLTSMTGKLRGRSMVNRGTGVCYTASRIPKHF